MTSLPSLAPLAGRSDGELLAVRDALAGAGYDGTVIGNAEAIAPRMLDAVRLPAVRASLRRYGGEAALLARLFAYGDTVEAGAIDAVLPADVCATLRETGVIERTGELERARFRIMPFEDVYVLSDEMDAPGDPVMGPGATTARLAGIVSSVDEDKTVLDVGCGAGTLAIVAARRGARAVGVDLHPRAVETARLNARLNGLELELHEGDLTAPVGGRTFDLVVSQPAFVVKPPDVEGTTYLHGGARGDELTLRLLSELPPLLGETGRGVVLFDAPVGDRLPPVSKRIRNALGAAAVRSASVLARGNDAATTAIGYSAVRHPGLGADYAESVARYQAHLGATGIRDVVTVLTVLRPAAEGRPIAVTRVVDDLGRFGIAAMQRFEEAARVVALADEHLVDEVVRVAPAAWLVTERRPDPEGERFRVRFEDGSAQDHDLSDAAMLLVEIVGAGQSVGRCTEVFAARVGAEPEEMLGQVLSFVRESLVAGLLTVG